MELVGGRNLKKVIPRAGSLANDDVAEAFFKVEEVFTEMVDWNLRSDSSSYDELLDEKMKCMTT